MFRLGQMIGHGMTVEQVLDAELEIEVVLPFEAGGDRVVYKAKATGFRTFINGDGMTITMVGN
jgi:hypothetical protein